MWKYNLVKFLENVEVGYEFSATSWPLHVTLVDDFFIGLSEMEIIQVLIKFLAGQQPVKTVALKDELLGPESNIPVTLLEVTPELLSLHNKLVEMLKASEVVLVSPEFSGSGYKPHVTVQGSSRIQQGKNLVIESVSIIDMQHKNDESQRKLLATIKL